MMPSLVSLVALASFTLASCTSEVPSIRSFFYIGGGYEPASTKGEHLWRNQMYVEHLRPVEHNHNDKVPIVLIHGQGQTGTNFLNTPDNRPGWASYFLSQGHHVYIVGQTIRGRSPWFPEEHPSLLPTYYSAERIEQRFTATQKYKLWPQAHLHSQWPGDGTMGDATFDAFFAANVQFLVNATLQESTVQEAGAKLLDKIGKPAVIFGHSQGGPLPLLIADSRPHLAAGLVLLEPGGPPFRDAVFSSTPNRAFGVSNIPLTYNPPVSKPDDFKTEVYPASDGETYQCMLQASSPAPRQLANVAKAPILVVTSESSYHAVYDHCTVDFLRQAGCSKLQHMNLADEDIHGNGHMFFMEKNNIDIAATIHGWIEKL